MHQFIYLNTYGNVSFHLIYDTKFEYLHSEFMAIFQIPLYSVIIKQDNIVAGDLMSDHFGRIPEKNPAGWNTEHLILTEDGAKIAECIGTINQVMANVRHVENTENESDEE